MATIVATRSPLFYTKVRGGLPVIADASKHTGNIFFVDSNAAGASDTAGYGYSPDKPLATIDYAIGLCTANQGDVIYVLPGHAETITVAITCDKAGISIIGLGEGSTRPAITGNAVIDVVTITAANVTIERLRFVTPSAAVTALVNVAANRAAIRGCVFELGAQIVDAVTITAAGELPTFEDNEVIVSANGPDSWLKFEGVIDRPIVRGNDVIGSDGTNAFDDGVLDFNSVAVTNPLVYDNRFDGADVATTVLANIGSVVGGLYGYNAYAGSATFADNAPGLGTGAITAAVIANGAIDAATFAAGAIDAAAIANAAIDAATFAAGAIDAAAIANGAIDAATFAAGAIDAAAIANAAIDAATFAAGAIDAAAIAADAITAAKIANGAIDAATFAAGAIDAAAIANSAIDAATFAAGAIDAAAIANGAIDAATFAAGAIDAAAIAADAITNAKIADNALATEQFALSAAEKTTDGVIVTKATAALPQSTSVAIFTVTGLVLLKRIVGYVTVQIGAFANATKLKSNSTGAGATTDISGTVDLNAAAVDTRLEITGTFANAMVATIDVPLAKVQVTELVIPPGTLMVDCAGSDGGGGRVRWSATYVPLESGAQIVAA